MGRYQVTCIVKRDGHYNPHEKSLPHWKSGQ